MKRTLLFTLLLITAFISLVVLASAGTEYIYDPHGLADSVDRAAVATAFESAEDESGVALRVYFNDGTKNYYLDDYDVGTKYGNSNTAVLLIEKMYYGGYEYELFTYGDAQNYISDTAADAILDNAIIYNSIKNGNFEAGILKFAELTASAVNEGRRSAKTTVIIVAVVLALLSGGTAFGVVFYKYKRKLKSPIYPLSKYATMNLEYSSDNFLGSNVVRTRVKSSSGGSSSGGGGFGGGSRGRR